MKIVLASASPRRKELLAQIGLEFEIVVSDVEEKITKTAPAEIVEELSYQKAEAVLKSFTSEEEILVIGADTIVAAENEIMGKPVDKDHAFSMLKNLQDTWHSVYTGVTLMGNIGGRQIEDTFHVQTKVKFYALSDEEILEYLNDPEYKDKAGSYAIQGLGTLLVEKIDGDFNNVVGLPVAAVHRHLKEMIQAGNISEV